MSLAKLAVVVPIGPGERAWRALLRDLVPLPATARVVLVAARDDDLPTPREPAGAPLAAEVVRMTAPRGRAAQLNAGAHAAKRHFLWFLHADSRLYAATLPALDRTLIEWPDALGYFDLRFRQDGPMAMRLNALGVHVRSRWLGLPFGDQGFFLSAATFERLGGFDPTLAAGEDHALVWMARRAGVPLVPAGAAISTSARKYAEGGWLRTTARHVRLTAAQAWRHSRRRISLP